MKFICSLCLLLSSTLYAREVILVENKATKEEAQMVLRVLQEKFNIPRKLITIRNIANECAKDSDAIMHLCLKENAEVDIVKMNKFVVEKTLRVFLEMEEN